MRTKQIWANLPVSDIARSTKFYQALGLRVNGKGTSELTSFFFAEHNFVIHFFERSTLEKGVGMKFPDLQGGSEIIFSLSAETREEVQQWLSMAHDAGGSIVKEAATDEKGFFWGAFADPDGHKFNVLLIEAGM